MAQKTMARKTMAQKTVAQKTMAQKTMAQKTMAQKTMAQKTVAQKTVAQKTMAQKTILWKTIWNYCGIDEKTLFSLKKNDVALMDSRLLAVGLRTDINTHWRWLYVRDWTHGKSSGIQDDNGLLQRTQGKKRLSKRVCDTGMNGS